MKSLYLIPTVFLIFACNGLKETSDHFTAKSGLFTILYNAQNQGRDTESNVIIDNQKALHALFQSVGVVDTPKIDFTKNQVVALFLGMKRTGGYSISVDRVEEVEGELIIYKKVEGPKVDEMVTTALTNPFVIVEIHSKKKIIFR